MHVGNARPSCTSLAQMVVTKLRQLTAEATFTTTSALGNIEFVTQQARAVRSEWSIWHGVFSLCTRVGGATAQTMGRLGDGAIKCRCARARGGLGPGLLLLAFLGSLSTVSIIYFRFSL